MVLIWTYCGKKGGVEGRTLHKFPLKDAKILEMWLQKMNLGSSFTPTNSSRICSEHFGQECFDKKDTRVMLFPGSIPTLFGEYRRTCAYCHSTKAKDKHLSFRKFPLEDPDLLKKWLEACKLQNFIPDQKSVLCSEHFDENCFYTVRNTSYQRLKHNVVPSIFKPLKGIQLNVGSEKRQSLEPLPATKYRRLGSNVTSRVHDTDKRKNLQDSDSVSLPIEHDMEMCDSPKNVADENCSVNEDSEPQAISQEQAIGRTAVPETPKTRNCKNPQTTPNTAYRKKIVQHDHSYETSPRTLKRKLFHKQKKLTALRQQSKVHKQSIGRLRRKIRTLKDIVSELRTTRAIPETGLACLDSIVDSDISQLLERFLKNKKNVGDQQRVVKKKAWKCQRRNPGLGISREKYPPALRSFAMTLHFYSPKAYGFVRHKFCQALPDPSTLRSWYSSISGEPGFTSESFDALKLKVDEAEKNNKNVICSLMLDEISIKRGLQNVSVGTIRGYVDIGSEAQSSDTLPFAKDALVLMIVSLDGSWKLPIGYFLINGIDSTTNAGLLTDSLIRLHDIGVRVVSVTLDGPPQHFSTMRVLGAKFGMENCMPFFLHPSTQEKVHIIFDACHMLKLIRNCLAEYKVLKDGDANTIEWRFIEELAKLQEKEGLRSGNKLKWAHLKYYKMKMKVYLAAQTLSSSVADSIEFCAQVLHLPQFQGSEATVRFIRCVDRVFDFLNSRNPFGKGFKAPLRRSNEKFWRLQISTEIDYLKNITDLESTLITKSRRYVPFVGFITAVLSVTEIFDTYVKPVNSQLKYLLTYKFSQDHLELFFCAIRSCGGWCPNPTSAQFISAYKRLLIHHEVKAVHGNATAMDSTKILSVPCTRSTKFDRYDPAAYDAMVNIRVMKKYGLDSNDDESSDMHEFLSEFIEFKNKLPVTLSTFSRSCVANISGWVVKKLVDKNKPIVRCERCCEALFQRSQVRAEFEDNRLVEAKTRGGLIFPSESVVRICLHAESILRHALNKIDGMVPHERNFPAILCSKIMSDLLQPPCTIFSSLNEHLYDDAVGDSNHIYLLTKTVCTTYIKLRVFAETTLASEAAVGDKIRHHLTRQIIWQHQ